MCKIPHTPKTNMKICVVGIGLIGGSMARALKANHFTSWVIGVDKSTEHLNKAIEHGIIDEGMSLEEGVAESDLPHVKERLRDVTRQRHGTAYDQTQAKKRLKLGINLEEQDISDNMRIEV